MDKNVELCLISMDLMKETFVHDFVYKDENIEIIA